MIKRFLVAGVLVAGLSVAVAAQEELVYIQIEARSTLSGAQATVRSYAGALDNLAGFSLGGGWYGVALGPYTRADATALLRDLRQAGRIPADSYIETSNAYGQQFWPVGAQAALAPVRPSAPTSTPAPAPAPAPATEPVVAEPDPQPPAPVVDETPREARASERLLSRQDREALQIALQWAGVYNAGIDGAFGRGTRRAMGEWQAQNGYEVTGILTTLQRTVLLQQYNAVLDGMDMRRVTDARAGVAIDLPTGAVSFDRYEAPFALYPGTGSVDRAQVLLISQPGDRQTMSGLYEIMQTLELVPLEGERKRGRDGFILTGANDRIVSHTEVSLRGDEIKGWTLIWPAGDEERRSRILALMQRSFARTEGVLDAGAVSDDGQDIDLVSGLRVRQPVRTGSGFFVDSNGTLLASAATVAGCERVTLDQVHEAQIVRMDEALGVAVLRPSEPLAPRGTARFAAAQPRLQSEIAVAGYSFGGVLAAPTLTFGRLEDLRGLAGEEDLKRLAMASLPGDTGGPVLDAGGAVLGMLLPRDDGTGRRLPDNVSFSAKASQILDVLRAAGVNARVEDSFGALAPEDLTALASDMTVLVSCWD